MLAAVPQAAAEPQDVYQRFIAARTERRLRHRDAAQAAGVSEGEAIASAVGRRDGLAAVRLQGPWPQLFEQVPRLGTVMALTRNDSCVHEKVGTYADMSHEGLIGLALGSAIDLRIFYMRWAHAFAVSEPGPHGVQRSLQIYDRHGEAIHKVFLREESDLMAWFEFVDANASTDQQPGGAFEPKRPGPDLLPDMDIDIGAFQQAWAAMTDTHEFFPLLRRFKLARTQALRLANSDFAYRVETVAARSMLQDAARDGTPIMCFVGNPGMIQIHSGPVHRFELMGEWLNVLDAGFNLHLREDRIASAWVVKKPTSDGVVTSLELFDNEGETIAMFFGERKPGKPELASWRALVERLPALTA
jgi:putative hemin transport protein